MELQIDEAPPEGGATSGDCGSGSYVPLLLSWLPASLNLLCTWRAQEHDGGDHGERDERDEEDVLHHARATLVGVELGLEPGLEDEQIHCLPLFGGGIGPSPVPTPMRSAPRRGDLIQHLADDNGRAGPVG